MNRLQLEDAAIFLCNYASTMEAEAWKESQGAFDPMKSCELQFRTIAEQLRAPDAGTLGNPFRPADVACLEQREASLRQRNATILHDPHSSAASRKAGEMNLRAADQLSAIARHMREAGPVAR